MQELFVEILEILNDILLLHWLSNTVGEKTNLLSIVNTHELQVNKQCSAKSAYSSMTINFQIKDGKT